MSRFDDVSYEKAGGTPYLSIHTTGARFNKAAVERFIGAAESVVFKYDENRDELGLFFGEGGTQARSLSGRSGRTVSIRGTLTSGAIGLDFCSFSENVRLEIKHDGLEGVPYVSLAPLREVLGQPHDGDVEDGDGVTESWDGAGDHVTGVTDGGTPAEPQAADYSGNPDVDQMVAQSGPRAPPEAVSEDASDDEPSDDERILALIEENGGRIRQSEIHGRIGRSKGHVSRHLREMDERGEVEKIRLGRSNIITLPDIDPYGASDAGGDEESEGADQVDEDAEEEADTDAIGLDLTQVDMTRVRELLPPNAGGMDVVEHVRSSQSSFGVARGLGVPREQAESLLEELGLDEHVTMRGESA